MQRSVKKGFPGSMWSALGPRLTPGVGPSVLGVMVRVEPKPGAVLSSRPCLLKFAGAILIARIS